MHIHIRTHNSTHFNTNKSTCLPPHKKSCTEEKGQRATKIEPEETDRTQHIEAKIMTSKTKQHFASKWRYTYKNCITHTHLHTPKYWHTRIYTQRYKRTNLHNQVLTYTHEHDKREMEIKRKKGRNQNRDGLIFYSFAQSVCPSNIYIYIHIYSCTSISWSTLWYVLTCPFLCWWWCLLLMHFSVHICTFVHMHTHTHINAREHPCTHAHALNLNLCDQKAYVFNTSKERQAQNNLWIAREERMYSISVSLFADLHNCSLVSCTQEERKGERQKKKKREYMYLCKMANMGMHGSNLCRKCMYSLVGYTESVREKLCVRIHLHWFSSWETQNSLCLSLFQTH